MEKCILCKKNKKKISKVMDLVFCNSCLDKDKRLHNHVKDFMNNNKLLDQNNIDIKSYHKALKKEARKFKTIVRFISREYEDIEERDCLTENIMENVDRINNSSGNQINPDKKTIVKSFKSMDTDSLKECSESLDKAKSYEDLVDIAKSKKENLNIMIPNPKDLFKKLSANLVKQDHAKKAIAMAISKHFCRILDPSIDKSNILILGPTGTGKTELVRLLAKEVNLPVAQVDASTLTASGYKGASVSDTIVTTLLSAANGDKNKAERGILFIDEIDKKALSNSNNATDIGTKNVQQELLKVLEGGILHADLYDSSGRLKKVELNTSQILFVAAGAFSGLEDLINKNLKRSIGLASINSGEELKKTFENVSTKELKEYGLIPEFLGRFSVITHTEELDLESLIKILNKRDNSILEQAKKTFKQVNCSVDFSTSFLEEVAEEALDQGIGARGLSRIFEKKLENIFFDIYEYVNKKIIIEKDSKVVVIPQSREVYL